MYQVQGHYLCLACYSKIEAMRTEQTRRHMAHMNFIVEQADEVAGSGYRTPRFKIPQPAPVIAPRGPISFNNIKVEGSIVGAINTGEVQRIDVAIDPIKMGDAALAASVKKFTEAVIADQAIAETSRTEVLEQLSFLTEQATFPKERRKTGLIRPVLDGIPKAIALSKTLLDLWGTLHPLLNRLNLG